MLSNDPTFSTTAQQSKRRGLYIPVPANFMQRPRVRSLIHKHGYAYLGIYFDLLSILRAQDNYRIEAEELSLWAEDLGLDLQPFLDLGLLTREETLILSPQLCEWMQPLDAAIEAKRAAGRSGGLAKSSTARECYTEKKQSVASFISSPLIRSNKEGGAGETAEAPNAPPAERLRVENVVLFEAEPEHGLPAGEISVIEYDQIRVHTPEPIIKRAARIIREQWIKKPDKRVKKLTADLTWALVEARKQAADNALARQKAARARDGPQTNTGGRGGAPEPMSPALRKPTISET